MVFNSLIIFMVFTNIFVSCAILYYVKKHGLPIYKPTVKEKKNIVTDTQKKHKIRYFSDEELWEKTKGR